MVMRSGFAYTQNEPGDMRAQSVMPSFWARLSESVVGTDFAATAPMPMRPSFNIISDEQRPLKMMILSVIST